LRECRRAPTFPGIGARRALVALPRIDGFRCVSTRATMADGAAHVDAAALAALGLQPGEEALVWSEDAH
jgi:arginine/ornithine N-succinyltransferase beta subunit